MIFVRDVLSMPSYDGKSWERVKTKYIASVLSDPVVVDSNRQIKLNPEYANGVFTLNIHISHLVDLHYRKGVI